MDNKNENKDILDILGHIVKNMATKDDLLELRTELKGDISELRGEMFDLRTELKGDISELRGELNDFKNETFERMDAFVNRVDTDKQEQKALESQVDRHEMWIHAIAQKTNVKLK